MVKARFSKLCDNLKEDIVYKFLFFFIIQGFTPSFQLFNLYFVRQEMGITKSLIAFSSMLGGIVGFFCPIVFQSYLRNTEYKTLFTGIQCMYCVQIVIIFSYVMRWNRDLGFGEVSDTILYVFSGKLIETIETLFTLMPAFIIMS